MVYQYRVSTLLPNLGRYSRKVVNGGRSHDRSYAELTTSVVIHERNRTYDRSKIRSLATRTHFTPLIHRSMTVVSQWVSTCTDDRPGWGADLIEIHVGYREDLLRTYITY